MPSRNVIVTAALMIALPCSLAARDYSPLLTGEVFSRTAQDIFVPHTSNWRASISMMLPEGEEVQPGDEVVAFDGSDTIRQLEQFQEQRRSQEAVTERDLARLEKEFTQAEFAVEQGKVALDIATLKAEIPHGLIGGIEYSDNQLMQERASKALTDALKKLTEKQLALQARRDQAELDRQKAELTETWLQELLERLSVKAVQKGYVIHANHPWTRAKFQEGDTVRTSFKVAEVADKNDLAVRVWVNAVDRPHIQAGAPVVVVFDALPDQQLEGHLETLSDSATKRKEWGKASYFEGTVSVNLKDLSALLPGMSALVEFR